MSKFLNSEQAKAEQVDEQTKTVEDLTAENQLLHEEKMALEKRLQIYGQQIGQYAIRIAELELQIKEMSAG
jgi:hypothetical protein